MSTAALGVSALFMVGCCAIAQIARVVSRRVVTREGLVPILINEAIAAAELCACCFELIIGKYIFKIFLKIKSNLGCYENIQMNSQKYWATRANYF